MVTERAGARPPRRAGDFGAPEGEAEIVIPLRTLLIGATITVAAFAGAIVVDRSRAVIAALALAITFALLAHPLARRIERVMPRGFAITVAVLGVLAITLGAAAAVARDIDDQADRVKESLHAVIDDFEPGSTPARVADGLDSRARIDEFLDSLALRTVAGDGQVSAVVEGAGRALLVTVLAGFLMLEGPAAVDRLIQVARRRSTRRALHARAHAIRELAGSYTRRMMAISVLHGVVAGLASAALDLPGPVSFAAWATALSTVPIGGAVVAWAPIVALASLQDRGTLVIGVLVALAAVAGDAVARHHWAWQRLRVGSLLPALGISLGVAMGGLPGGLVGLYAAAAVAAALGPAAAVGDRPPGDDLMEYVDQADLTGTQIPLLATVPAPDLADPGQPTRPLARLGLSRRTMFAGAGLGLTLWILYLWVHRAGPFMVWGTLGLLIAIALDRPIAAIQRRAHLHRAFAVGGVLVAAVLVATMLGVLFGPRANSATRSIAADAPETVASLEELPVIGSWLRNSNASDRLQRWIEEVPDRVSESGIIDRVADLTGDALVGALWTGVIAIAALLDGPRLVDAACRRVRPRSRRTAIRLGRAAYTALSRYAGGAVFVAGLNGTVVFVVALALGIPLAPLLAVWAAAWNFIPQIGGLVGGAPLVLLAAAEGPWHGVVAAGVFITYQTFENHVVQPAVIGRTIRIPAWVALVGALVGGSIFGFLGAIIAAPAIGIARVAVAELGADAPARVDDGDPPAASA